MKSNITLVILNFDRRSNKALGYIRPLQMRSNITLVIYLYIKPPNRLGLPLAKQNKQVKSNSIVQQYIVT